MRIILKTIKIGCLGSKENGINGCPYNSEKSICVCYAPAQTPQIAVWDGVTEYKCQIGKKEWVLPFNGVAVCGRPPGRHYDDGLTMEVTRLCTDGTSNACSMLYAACWRVAKNMGYKRMITYILNTEPGTSLKASGWKLIGQRGGGSWSVPSRPRIDKHPLQKKLLFEIS